MSIEFPLFHKQTPLGPIADPTIPLSVRLSAGYVTYRFLVDTGAEFSVATRRLALQIGLAWDALPEIGIAGVGQTGTMARLGHLPIRLGVTDLDVRCLFVDSSTVPFLLGRADFLDRFVVTINSQQQKIVLDPIP